MVFRTKQFLPAENDTCVETPNQRQMCDKNMKIFHDYRKHNFAYNRSAFLHINFEGGKTVRLS